MSTITPASRAPSRVVAIGLAAIWLILSINLLVTVGLFQPNVLTWDQWDFFKPLFNDGTWRDLFTLQHGPHRQGAAFVITSWILDATRWDARLDSLWIASLLSVASALALRLKWRLTGTLRMRDGWIPIVGLTLGQFEGLLVVPNASHSVFPLMLMLAMANVWLMRNDAVRYLCGGVAAVGLTFTGFGLFAGAMFTLLLGAAIARHAYRREWMSGGLAFLGFLIAVAGWVWFGSGYRFMPAVAGFRFPWTPFYEYFQFIPLMLLQPTGLFGDTGFNYAAGGFLALLTLIATASVTWKWIRTSESSPANDVILLLIGGGVLFVCNTAVGRVCLSITAGMSSRYIPLLFPLWLGIYLWSETTKHRRLALITTAAMWCVALWPYRDMTSRPLSRWPGTLGATNVQYAYFEDYGTNKAAWVDTYLKTQSIDAAQEARGNYVYPHPAGTRMDEKLRFLKQRELLFFAPGKSFLPLLLGTRTIWNNEFPSSNSSRILDGNTRLTFVTKKAGVAEIAISRNDSNANESANLEMTHGGTSRTFALSASTVVIAVPVEAGFNDFAFQLAGAPEGAATPPTITISPPILRESASAGSLPF